MASSPQPVRLTRQQLSAFLPTPELVRAFEAFIKQLAELTPDELNVLAANVETAQGDAFAALAASSVAIGTAIEALQLAQQVENLSSVIASQQAQLHALAQRVSALDERP